MFVNTSKEYWSFIFQLILPKYVHMGWKSQETLKSSIPFISEHIFSFHTSFLSVFNASWKELFESENWLM